MNSNAHRIKCRIRKFIKHINNNKLQISWFTNKSVSNLKFEYNNYCTDAICLHIDNIRDHNCRFLKSSSKLIFAIKLLNNCFPIIDILKYCYKNLKYDTHCTFYKKSQKSLEHLIICNNLNII